MDTDHYLAKTSKNKVEVNRFKREELREKYVAKMDKKKN